MSAQQRFVDDDVYRAARGGELIVNKLASRRKFTSWGAWASTLMNAVTEARLVTSSGGQLMPVAISWDGAHNMASKHLIISCTASAPQVYSEVDPVTLRTTTRKFEDLLRVDYATVHPKLDIDGASYLHCGIMIPGGIVVFRVVKTDTGLARIELGRSSFRHDTRPTCTTALGTSLKYIVIPECPLYFNLNRTMGTLSATRGKASMWVEKRYPEGQSVRADMFVSCMYLQGWSSTTPTTTTYPVTSTTFWTGSPRKAPECTSSTE